MGNHKLMCITACLLSVAVNFGFGKVLFPQLPAEAAIECMRPGKADGQVLKGNTCNVTTSDEDVARGLLPNGKCVQCGAYELNFAADCKPNISAISFVKGDFRLCACNVGFYGDQFASSCKKCPAGYTTPGYGATNMNDCNICATGFVRKAGKCVSCSSLFKGIITTAGPGNNTACVCPKGYTGQPGSCKSCVGYDVTTAFPGAQTCVCPAGGKPPFCRPCKSGEILGDKCECPVGKTGVWPKCDFCPRPWQYRVTTLKPGNNQPCVCSLASTIEDTPARYLLQRSPKDGACACREDTGFFLKAVPNLVWNSEWSSGPCMRPYKGWDKFTKVVRYDGKNRLGCDAKKGYGASLAAVVFTEGGSGPLCVKCSGNAYIDAKTTKCLCKPGYAVNPLFGKLDEKNNPVTAPFKSGYCLKCDDPSVAVGTLPYTKRNDTFCRCNWEKGYSGTPDNIDFRGECEKCPDVNMFVDTSTGVCKCKEGYFMTQDGKKCEKSPTCQEGEVLDFEGKCTCPLVKDGNSCTIPGEVCSKVRLSYWTNVKAADAKFPFPSTLLQAAKADYLSKDWSVINTTANLVTLSPVVKSPQNVAVLVEGCVCSRGVAQHVIEVSSVGSARLSTVENNENMVWIDQDKFHTTTLTTYTSLESGRYDPCITFTLSYYSGASNGALALRTAPFDFSAYEGNDN